VMMWIILVFLGKISFLQEGERDLKKDWTGTKRITYTYRRQPVLSRVYRAGAR
jgi:hypothetical protein